MCYNETLLECIFKAIPIKNRRFLRRRERALEKKTKVEFNKQMQSVLSQVKVLFQEFGLAIKQSTPEIDGIFDNLDDEKMIEQIIETSGISMEFGAKYRINKHDLSDLGISFDLLNTRALEYLKTDRPLQLAKMTDTTKKHIKPLILEAVESGESYTELAKKIRKNYAFSRQRSLLIATNEVGLAYAEGNNIPMVEAQNRGEKVEKSWLTAGPARSNPRLEHNTNQADGWIPLNGQFSGDGANTAPKGLNCRCDTLYQIL